MPELKIIYLAGFNLSPNTGRNKATLEKARALEEIYGTSRFRMYSPHGGAHPAIAYSLFDLKMFFRLLIISRDTVVIQRQAFLPVTNTWLRIRRIKIVCEVHGDVMDELKYLNKSMFSKVLIVMLAAAERYNRLVATAYIFNHPALMPARNSRPAMYSYNGANTTDFFVRDMTILRKELGIDQSLKLFMFAGMVSPWHGVDLLMDVFRQPALADFALLVVGMRKDAYSEKLKAKASSNILFADHTSVGETARYVNAADVCLLPVKNIRKSPGSPLKLYDYIACGKPVITQKNVLGYADEVLNYHLGAVTNFYDPVVAANDLQTFYHHADMDFYRRNNRLAAENKLSWKTRMTDWARFIKSL